jgi:hypothetical protein
MSSQFTIRTLFGGGGSQQHYPMHHLFSPTALDHDLSYVDKTYYTTSAAVTAAEEEQLHATSESTAKLLPSTEKTSVHAMVLNRTVSLVNSISRLDL